MSKKILFIVTQSEFGGAQRYVFEVVIHLDPEKYEVLVAAGQGNGELFRKIKNQKPKIKIFPLKYLKRTPWPWQIVLGIKEIYDLLKKEGPDILFLCSTTAGFLGSIAAAIYRSRYTQTKLALQDTQIDAEKDEFLYPEITYKIRGACFKIWKQFRGAFKEKVIERVLKKELENQGLKVDVQKQIPIIYENEKMGIYVPDMIINNKVLIELKRKPFLTKEDEKQFWLYLKGSEYRLGLLINFGRRLEIRRRIYDKARRRGYIQMESASLNTQIYADKYFCVDQRMPKAIDQRLSASTLLTHKSRTTQIKLASRDTQKNTENYQRVSAYPEGQNQRLSASTLKVIYRIGGWAFRDPRNFVLNKFLLWAEKLTASLKDKIIVNSEEDLQLAIKYKICPPEKIIKIYNGIDISELEFLPREEARQKLLNFNQGLSAHLEWQNQRLSDYVIIGTVANFYKTKGLPYLIEAAHILKSKIKNQKSKIIIIGEGKERKKLELLIKKYNLENQVFLLGRIPEAYRYFKAFDVFVLPSLKEGFPWVILEAMAAEVPILTTKIGALPEIIKNGVTGFLVQPKNSPELAEKIIWLLNHPKDVKKIKISAKEKLKEFTFEKMIQETEKLFC